MDNLWYVTSPREIHPSRSCLWWHCKTRVSLLWRVKTRVVHSWSLPTNTHKGSRFSILTNLGSHPTNRRSPVTYDDMNVTKLAQCTHKATHPCHCATHACDRNRLFNMCRPYHRGSSCLIRMGPLGLPIHF